MTHHINHDGKVAVAADVFWMPIDDTTPRNVKVLAISRERSGVLQVAEIRTVETWLTHWHPLPRFRMDGDCSNHQAYGSPS